MRLILFFDLPSITSDDIRSYNKFRKSLLKEGFMMLQESVYCKLALNMSVVRSIKNKILKIVPGNGNIQLLTITEKQFVAIEYLAGELRTQTANSTDRLLIL